MSKMTKENVEQIVTTFQGQSAHEGENAGQRNPGLALHYDALAFFPLLLDAQCHARRLAKGLVDAAVLHGRALKVTGGSYSPRDLETLLVRDCGRLLVRFVGVGVFVGRGARAGCVFAFVVFRVLAEVALEGDENELHAGAVVCDFANPLGLNVFQRVLAVDRVAEHDQVRIIYGEAPS